MSYTALNRTTTSNAAIGTDTDNEDTYIDSAIEPLLTTSSNYNDQDFLNSVNISDGRSKMRFGILSNRREYKKSHIEYWRSIRMGILSAFFVFFIYICITFSVWIDERPQIVVNIPPMDESLPGPRGKLHYTSFF